MVYEQEWMASHADIERCCDAMGILIGANVVQTFAHEQGAGLSGGYFGSVKRARRPKGTPREEWEANKPEAPKVVWSAHLTKHRDGHCAHDLDEDYPISAEPMRFCPFCGTEVIIYQYEPNHSLARWELDNWRRERAKK